MEVISQCGGKKEGFHLQKNDLKTISYYLTASKLICFHKRETGSLGPDICCLHLKTCGFPECRAPEFNQSHAETFLCGYSESLLLSPPAQVYFEKELHKNFIHVIICIINALKSDV